ncbi:MAG: class I SAM-dependent methyltransferase [Methanosarcinales archaeon]|nr:class I SAM-dependent methyltransferase [Methanosarcinales archaeon]
MSGRRIPGFARPSAAAFPAPWFPSRGFPGKGYHSSRQGSGVSSDGDAWDRDYLKRGRLWAGAPPPLPPLPPGTEVLELGSGNGKALLAMLGRGWKVVGVDISSRAASLSRELARTAGSPAELLVADGRRLPFIDRSFDAVFAYHVLGHLREAGRQSMAEEAMRVLSPGGRLFFRGFGVRDMRFGRGREVERGTFCRGEGVMTHYFTLEEVGGLFGRLSPQALQEAEWTIRIQGQDHLRSEVTATFLRPGEKEPRRS